MTIENQQQLENTRAKLRELQELCKRTQDTEVDDAHVRDLTVRSLKKRINQFKEEITRYECRASVGG